MRKQLLQTNSHARGPAAVHQLEDVVVDRLVDGFFKFVERLHLRDDVVAEHLRGELVKDYLLEVLPVGKHDAVGDLRLLLEQEQPVIRRRLAETLLQKRSKAKADVLGLLEEHRRKERLFQIYIDYEVLLDSNIVQMSVPDAETTREDAVQHDLASDLLQVLAVVWRQRKDVVQQLVVRQLLQKREICAVCRRKALLHLLLRDPLVVVESGHQIRGHRLIRLQLCTLP